MSTAGKIAADFAAELESIGERTGTALTQLARLAPPPRGATTNEVVYQEDQLKLRYYGQGSDSHATPLLVVYSLVNRPYILDLKPERSLIRSLRDAGHAVYLIDWGEPEAAHRFLNLDDYIDGYIRRCVERIRRRHDCAKIDLLGVCQGGTLGLCFAALYPQRVAKLINLVTPVDFHAGDGTLQQLTRHLDLDAVIDSVGNVPSQLLNGFFVSLKPYRLLSQRYLELANLANDAQGLADFLQLEQWMYDSPSLAGEACRQFAQECYQANKLVRGELEIAGQPIRLQALTMPICNVYATADHLVPPESARALQTYIINANYEEVEFAGGHLSVFISGRAQRQLFPQLAAWLRRSP